jgi:NitT/TauT family transport system substrate-binding protein
LIRTCCIIFTAVTGLVAGTPAVAADKVVLMLNWYLYGEHAPFFYGLEKGYYAAEGIDLDIQEGRGSGPTTQAVAAKTAAFGYVDLPTMMRVAVKGAPVIATGVLLQKSPMSVMGFEDKNIRKPADIKGKIVAMTPGGSNEQIWPLFLKKAGLKEDDFKTVSGDAQTKLNAVISGQADLVLGYPMDQGMKILDATGKRVYAIKCADYGINLVSSGIIAHKDMLKDNPDLVRRFMAASSKAVANAVKDPQGAADAMLKANSKAGQRDTLILHARCRRSSSLTRMTANRLQPFRVTPDQINTGSNMVEYGGLIPSRTGSEAYFTPTIIFRSDHRIQKCSLLADRRFDRAPEGCVGKDPSGGLQERWATGPGVDSGPLPVLCVSATVYTRRLSGDDAECPADHPHPQLLLGSRRTTFIAACRSRAADWRITFTNFYLDDTFRTRARTDRRGRSDRRERGQRFAADHPRSNGAAR